MAPADPLGTGGAASLPLWPLPLAAGLLPAAAALAALAISGAQDLVPLCNPFFDGCTSVSRAARHGLANQVFRALVLPAAALQALSWIVATRWLRALGDTGARGLASLGVVAGVALVLYGSFLGSDGEVYRWLRRYGTVAYFGGTCLCMLIAGGALQRRAAAGRLALPPWLARLLPVLLAALVVLGLANAFAGAVLDGDPKDRVENICEWWGSLVIVLVFVALAVVWRRCRLRATLSG